MSIFASETTETIPLPFDAPHTVTIQKLTGRQIEDAQAEHLAAFVGGRSPRGWEGVFKMSIAKGTAAERDAVKALRDPLAGYDRTTIVKHGLKSWTYVDGEKVKPVTPKAIDDLDDEAMEFIAVEIMKLTKPGLFLSEQALEAARKND